MPYVNLAPERQTLDRQRKMAEALQQQAFSPIQMPNYPGANVSAAAPVSKLVEALLGALANKRLDKKEKNLQTSEDFQRLTQAGGLLNSLINPTPGSSYSVPMAPTRQAGIPDTLGGEPGAAPPPQQPEGARSLALPPNPDEQAARGQTIQKLAQALTSRDPMIAQFGNLQLQQALAGQNRSADQQFDIQKMLQQQAGQQGLQQASQQFQTGERKAGETFTAGENKLTREERATERAAPEYRFFDAGPGGDYGVVETKSGKVTKMGVNAPSGSGNVPVDQQELNDWLKKNPTKGPSDFMVYKAGLSAANTKNNRPVTSGDANKIADYNTSVSDIDVLNSVIGEGATGTKAKLGAMAPNWLTELTGWGADAKSRQAVIDRVKQVIGKALEGGVLRKEDEYKYEKILPTIYDVPNVVTSKLDGLKTAINQRRGTLLDSLDDAGFNVDKYRQREQAPQPPPPAATSGWSVKVKK